jgi:hypothetical protein
MRTALLSVSALAMRITQQACLRAVRRNGERLRRTQEPAHNPKAAGSNPAPATTAAQADLGPKALMRVTGEVRPRTCGTLPGGHTEE